MLTRIVRKVHELGVGPSTVVDTSARASSPGPCRNRSSNLSRCSKTPPTRATLLVAEQPIQSGRFIVVQPAVDSIWVARLQQAVACHCMCRLPTGDFQHGGTAFAHKRMRVVVAMVLQFL